MLADLLDRNAEEAVAGDLRGDTGLLAAHLGAARSLARGLLRNDADAEDAVQEAYVRACEHFHSFRGENGRSWLLTIVRNCCYDHLKRGAGKTYVEFDEEVFRHGDPNPESSLLRQEQFGRVADALRALPRHLHEVLVFREFEEMSYREIAAFVGIPIGTVMSRLSRGRQLLRRLVFLEPDTDGMSGQKLLLIGDDPLTGAVIAETSEREGLMLMAAGDGCCGGHDGARGLL
jgi:RNA polymerase sigma factor (sigma-70 family)